MALISEQAKEDLKKPLGILVKSIQEIAELSRGKRIIAIGDVCTAALLGSGMRPHVAVFDLHSMRADVDDATKSTLMSAFKEARRYVNPPGTVSDELIADAKGIIRQGGAVLIDGEEDLTALAFILAAGEGDVVIYGQPREGIVLVRPERKLKNRVRGWLSC